MRLPPVILALAPIVAVAQPLIPQKVSLGAQALNSRYIVVGTIVKIERPEMWTGGTSAVIKGEKWQGVGGASAGSGGVSEGTPSLRFPLRARGTAGALEFRDGLLGFSFLCDPEHATR